MASNPYPDVVRPELMGTYPARVKAGGGYVWDAVLEYRVWCCPERGASDLAEGSDYYHVFETYEEARGFAQATTGADEPLALILQEEYLDEPEAGRYIHVQEKRIAEWPVVFLQRPKRTPQTIPAFLAPDAPANRLDILRGHVQTFPQPRQGRPESSPGRSPG